MGSLCFTWCFSHLFLVIFIVMMALSLVTIFYEWLRHESGLFKPYYSLETVLANIKTAEEGIAEHKNDTNFKTLMDYQDKLDYWKEELNKIERYNRRHGK